MVGRLGKISRNSAYHPPPFLEGKGLGTKVKEGFPATAASNGVEHTEEFHPVEHPLEPPDVDQPVRCLPPEPCIMNDGRIWKERLAASARQRSELMGAMKENDHIKYYSSAPRWRRRNLESSKDSMLPSHSAPERDQRQRGGDLQNYPKL